MSGVGHCAGRIAEFAAEGVGEGTQFAIARAERDLGDRGFAALQSRLRPLFQRLKNDTGAPRTVVVVPGISVPVERPPPSGFGCRRRRPSVEQLDVPVTAVHADPPAVADRPGRVGDPDDGGEAVLARDHRAVGHQAADLGDQPRDRDEER